MRNSGSQPEGTSLLADVLRGVTQFTARRPHVTLWCIFLVSSACIGYTIAGMQFKTDRADLLDPKADFHKRWLEYSEKFGESADIVIVVEADRPEKIEAALEAIGSKISQEPALFESVLYKTTADLLRSKGLQYLSPNQLESGLRRLDEYGPILRGKWGLLRLENLIPRLRQQVAQLPTDPQNNSGRSLLLQTHAFVDSLDRYAEEPHEFVPPWPNMLPIDNKIQHVSRISNYLLSEDGKAGFIKAKPVENKSDFTGAASAIAYLRKIVPDASRQFPGTRIGLTGIPVLESDEMVRSQQDMLKASLISFFGVGLILLIGFRGIRHPLLALLMLAAGMTWAFGYTTLTIGHLNILSVSFAAILIGLGIDFAIHYLSRYLSLRKEGKPLRPALIQASGSVGSGIVTAAMTTALAFFAATQTEFLGIAELGIIAGGGILLCALATFIVLPSLIALADRDVEPAHLPTPFEGVWLRKLIARFPAFVLIASVATVAGVAHFGVEWKNDSLHSKVKYDYNLLNLQAEDVESVKVQRRLHDTTGTSLLYAVSIADSLDEAQLLKKKFEALPSVARVEDLASRVPQYPIQYTLPYINGYSARLRALPQEPGAPTNVNPMLVGMALEQLYQTLAVRKEVEARRAATLLDEYLSRFETMPLQTQIDYLRAYQHRMALSLLDQFEDLRGSANPEPITMRDFPPALTSRYLSGDGQWLLQVYPKDRLWDIDPLRKFVADVRKVDPDVTGTPLQNFEATRQIKKSYETAAIYSLAVIGLVLLVGFVGAKHMWTILLPPLVIVAFAYLMMETRRMDFYPSVLLGGYVAMAVAIGLMVDFASVRDALLSLLTPLAGAAMMFGMLGLFDVHFNPANLLVLPLVLGIGVDDGVHVLHDFRSQRGRRYMISGSTVNAIMLTSLTSMIGFGSMMISSHRGLYSLGLVLVLGVGSCLFVSMIMLPAILSLISQSRNAVSDELEESDTGSNRSSGGNGGNQQQRNKQGNQSKAA